MTPERLRQIQKLYLSARDHDPSTRPEFLAQACGSDEDLRREVETLLAEGGGEVLDRPALEIAAELLERWTPWPWSADRSLIGSSHS